MKACRHIVSHIKALAGPAVCCIGLVLGAGLLAACDTVEPVEDSMLVVEAFFDAGKPLPEIKLRRTLPLSARYGDDAGTAVPDAEVSLLLDGATVVYLPVPGGNGTYAPAGGAFAAVPPRAVLALQVRWQEHLATAQSLVPPPIRIDSVRIDVPDEPVAAVYLDSLLLEPGLLDSLGFDSLGTGFERGFIYPVEVKLWWHVDFVEADVDSAYWVRTHLKPLAAGASDAFNFFLRPEQVQRERSVKDDGAGRRSWTGIYAVPVTDEDDPLPVHRLRVALIRSGRDYARFATSRDAPDRREPVSNVSGGIGIVAGMSVDSLVVEVR